MLYMDTCICDYEYGYVCTNITYPLPLISYFELTHIKYLFDSQKIYLLRALQVTKYHWKTNL